MANLLGKPFRKYVNETVTSRQIASGIKENRSLEVISALNSRNAWIKFASAVSIDQNRLNILNQTYEGGNPLLEGIPPGFDLAIKYVLFNGLTQMGTVEGTSLQYTGGSPWSGLEEVTKINFQQQPRAGILGYQPNPAYGVGGIEFGYSPMPGIIDMELTDLSRGSIKKSTLNIKCHNKAQFDIIDVLYLRLGYTVCLEWGWNHYLEIDELGNETLSYTGDTLIDNEFWKVKNEEYSDFLDRIEKRRKETKGNYDGIIGVVSNFSWNFQPDGTYDIRLEVTSLGDVIESLKVNLPPLVKSKRDPYAEQRLESIKKSLEDNYVSQNDFYNTLYPGLDDEINKVYQQLKQAVNNGKAVFNFAPIAGASLGEQKYKITLNEGALDSSLYTIDFENIADVAGGRDLLRSKIPNNFQWGRIFDDDPAHEGSIHNNSWKVRAFDTSIDNSNHWFFNTKMTEDQTATQILYKRNNNTYGVEDYLKGDKRWLTDDDQTGTGKSTPTTEFEYYILIGWNRTVLGFGKTGPNLQNGDSPLTSTFFTTEKERTFGSVLSSEGQLEANKLLFTYYGAEQFQTLFYSWSRQVANVAGGDDDERFQDQEDPEDRYDGLGDTDKELAKSLDDFISSIERNKFNNKINNWFYNIRQLHADVTYNFNLVDVANFYDDDVRNDYSIQLKDGTTVGAYRNDDGSVDQFRANNLQDYDTWLKSLNPVLYTALRGLGTAGIIPDIQSENQRLLSQRIENPTGISYSGLVEGANQDNLILLEGGKFDANPVNPNPPEGRYVDPIGQCLNLSVASWRESVGFPQYNDPKIPVDFIKLDIQPIQDSYFVRLGVLLNFINNFLIPKKEGNGKAFPIIQIDTHVETNICYIIDNVISVNPRKCIVANEEFYAGEDYDGVKQFEVIYKNLEKYQIIGEDYRYGQLMNIYFNFRRVEEIFSSVDKNNQVSLFTVLKSICDDINESLGNINNLEPVIDRDKNVINLIDQTTIPNIDKIRKALQGKGTIEENDYELKAKQTPLEVFGYNNVTDQSNFVRNAGITTEISKNYATAITIGATAQGEVPGMENTAFSRWNVGLTDRFKNNLIDGQKESGSLEEQNKEVMENYETFIDSGYNKLGFNKKDRDLSINDEFISTNRSIANSFYVYAQAQTTLANYDETTNEGLIESSIGFLPINLKLEMDGIGGIRIYDFVKVNLSFLPSNYPDTLEFICTGVNHKLADNDWTTNLKTIATYIDKGSKATSATS